MSPSFQKILMIDNYDSFTFNVVDYMEQLGSTVHVYRNTADPSIIDQLQPDLIVISPGPSVPKNAGNLMKMIEVSHQKYPMFGICLGLEAMIEFFGGSLKFVTPVHGKSSPIHHDGQTIFTGLEQDFLGGRYHSLVAERVPDCFDITAVSSDLVMGIRHRTLPIEGVQFHPESVLSMKGQQGFELMKNVIAKNLAHV